MHDLVIRNGLVVDGTGGAPRHADVAIDPRAYSMWSEDERRWRDVTYDVVLHVGTSSRDVAFTLPVDPS